MNKVPMINCALLLLFLASAIHAAGSVQPKPRTSTTPGAIAPVVPPSAPALPQIQAVRPAPQVAVPPTQGVVVPTSPAMVPAEPAQVPTDPARIPVSPAGPDMQNNLGQP